MLLKSTFANSIFFFFSGIILDRKSSVRFLSWNTNETKVRVFNDKLKKDAD